MNEKFKKVTAVVLVSSFVLSLITIVYANHSLGFFPLIVENKPISDKPGRYITNTEDVEYPTLSADAIAKNKQGGAIDRTPIPKAGVEVPSDGNGIIKPKKSTKVFSRAETKNTYRVKDNNQTRQGLRALNSAETMHSEEPVSVIDGKEQEYHATRAENLRLLSAAYPNEYEIVKSKIENEILHVNFLEFIDFYIIDDVNLLVDDYSSEGSEGMEKHAVIKRNRDDRVIK